MAQYVLTRTQLQTLSNTVQSILSARTGAIGTIYTPTTPYGRVSDLASSQSITDGMSNFYEDAGGTHSGAASSYLVSAKLGAELQNNLLEITDMTDGVTSMSKVDATKAGGVSDMFAPSYYNTLTGKLNTLKSKATSGSTNETSDCRSACTGLCATSCIGFCNGCNTTCTGSCRTECTGSCVTGCSTSCRTTTTGQTIGPQGSQPAGSAGSPGTFTGG